MPGMSRTLLLTALLLPPLLGLGCKTLGEVAVGYADAITTTSLPTDEGGYAGATISFPALTDMDPLSSPALSRYEVAPEEVESVKLSSVELDGPSNACGLPFSKLELQVVAAELGPVTVATASGGECLEWTLTDEELGPWFRQPKLSIVALADGQPWTGGAESLSLRVSFLIDIEDKRIE
jgi:hypothetical protein